MPFDGANHPSTDVAKLTAAIALLRDRSLWPKGFVWDYGSCRTCAMGLLYAATEGVLDGEVWDIITWSWRYWDGVLSAQAQLAIFLNLTRSLGRSYGRITPDDVVDALNRVLQRLLA